MSNAISESTGHSVNMHRAGVRSQLGPMYLEDGCRLRCIPPMESQEVNKFLLEVVLPTWIDLGGTHACGDNIKAKTNPLPVADTKEHCFLPKGKREGKSTSRALFRKRSKTEKYKALLIRT